MPAALLRLIFHRPVTLRSQLTTLVLATLLPLLIFSGFTIYLLAKRERTTFPGATERSRALITAVDAALKGSMTALDGLANNEDLQAGDLRGFYRAAARMLKTQPDWSTINLADRSGQQLFNLLRPFGSELPKVQGLAEIAQVLQKGNPVIGNMLLGPVSNQYDFAIRVPVIQNGVIKYVLSAVIRHQAIAHLLAQQNLSSDWIGLVIDKNQRFVARAKASDQFIGQLASQSLRDALTRSPDGWFRGATVEGLPVYTAYSRSSFSGWSVSISIPAAAVDRPIQTPILYIVLFGAALMGFGVALAGCSAARQPTRSNLWFSS